MYLEACAVLRRITVTALIVFENGCTHCLIALMAEVILKWQSDFICFKFESATCHRILPKKIWV